MAGHSKWANIKHRKGAQDAKRGKIFTRIIKEISIAVKESGHDVESNPRLRTAIANARSNNMPKDTIERAIKKASGADAENYQEVTFEGYGPNGIGIFVECTTDNTTRTVANIRAIFNKHHGSLGTNGSLEFIFDRKGTFLIERDKLPNSNIEELELELIDFGLDEIDVDDELITVYTNFEDFGNMQTKLEEMKIEIKNAELQRVPNSTKLLSIEDSKKILRMIDKFENDDDVQSVFHNMEITEELINSL